MSQRLRVAFVASIGATMGTAYFLLSDGGNTDIARARLEEVVERAQAEVNGLPKVLSGASLSVGENSKVGDLSVTADLASKEQVAEDSVSSKLSASSPHHDGHAPESNSPRRQLGEGSAVCHSCSGPRLWFYADKFGATRLKRRFTPNADP